MRNEGKEERNCELCPVPKVFLQKEMRGRGNEDKEGKKWEFCFVPKEIL